VNLVTLWRGAGAVAFTGTAGNSGGTTRASLFFCSPNYPPPRVSAQISIADNFLQKTAKTAKNSEKR
jgi:hypothetical protein